MKELLTLTIVVLAFVLVCFGVRRACKRRVPGGQAVPINFEVYKAKEEIERQTRFG
jgi:hypothetical protein